MQRGWYKLSYFSKLKTMLAKVLNIESDSGVANYEHLFLALK